MAISFMKRVQGTPKMKALKKKIKANESTRKMLSRKYKSLVKSEAKRLGKKTKKRTAKRKTKRRR